VSRSDTNSIAASATDRFSDMLRNLEQKLIARMLTLKQKLGQKADVEEVRCMTGHSQLQA